MAQVVPSLDPVGLNLLEHMLRYEPNKRITARAALTHPYFADIEELYSLQLSLT
jgi:serine/threonine protein kinase